MNSLARIIEDIRNDPDDHKDYEGYNEGWVDACNRIADALVEPVPASERFPGPEHCDSEGRCWWLDRPFRNGPAVWVLRRTNDGILLPFIAWLPHWALPASVDEPAEAP